MSTSSELSSDSEQYFSSWISTGKPLSVLVIRYVFLSLLQIYMCVGFGTARLYRWSCGWGCEYRHVVARCRLSSTINSPHVKEMMRKSAFAVSLRKLNRCVSRHFSSIQDGLSEELLEQTAKGTLVSLFSSRHVVLVMGSILVRWRRLLSEIRYSSDYSFSLSFWSVWFCRSHSNSGKWERASRRRGKYS